MTPLTTFMKWTIQRFAFIGVLTIVLEMSLAFLTYDFVVYREFTAKKELVEAIVIHALRTSLTKVRTPFWALLIWGCKPCIPNRLYVSKIRDKRASVAWRIKPMVRWNAVQSKHQDWLALTEEIQLRQESKGPCASGIDYDQSLEAHRGNIQRIQSSGKEEANFVWIVIHCHMLSE